MGMSLLCGALEFLSLRPERAVVSDLGSSATYMAIAFWVFFLLLYFGYARKSAATLEYQRRVAQDEESWKASRKGPDAPK